MIMGRYNGNEHTKEENDNRANQLNPEHDAFWQSQGQDERPEDWQDRVIGDD